MVSRDWTLKQTHSPLSLSIVSTFTMWRFASKAIAGATGLKNGVKKPAQVPSELSDDEVSLNNGREEGLECPICFESFNIVENVPYVLWCGHTLCKNCVFGLQRAIVKLPTLPVQLPFFISCPWCNILSLRLVYKGDLKLPRKNFFLLWMVESMNGDRSKSYSSSLHKDHLAVCSLNRYSDVRNQVTHLNNRRALGTDHTEQSNSNHDEGHQNVSHFTTERLQLSVRKSLMFFAHLTVKFPLIVVFLLIILYAIPASAAILALYIIITLVFALPSFLVLFFAFPSLDWLVREIIT
ncbi:zf-RING_LisH domain-containing protein [Cephalotus follicularis]|uniref:Zf-RING_LisH domain-containing protein n=1 Tax=Cephalotus follicularis TaxID=3775 RepID=A0A1Q3BJY0_CEPFO|nr:zf-RING_LisH domain-containing protein [Cephalotus follicularis]